MQDNTLGVYITMYIWLGFLVWLPCTCKTHTHARHTHTHTRTTHTHTHTHTRTTHDTHTHTHTHTHTPHHTTHQDEWRHLISGGTTVPQRLPNPAPDWITDHTWSDILTLPCLPSYGAFVEEFSDHVEGFKKIFDSQEPHRCASAFFVQSNIWVMVLPLLLSFPLSHFSFSSSPTTPHSSREPLPAHWNTDLDDFQKLLALKCIRADKLTNAMQVTESWQSHLVQCTFTSHILYFQPP